MNDGVVIKGISTAKCNGQIACMPDYKSVCLDIMSYIPIKRKGM